VLCVPGLSAAFRAAAGYFAEYHGKCTSSIFARARRRVHPRPTDPRWQHPTAEGALRVKHKLKSKRDLRHRLCRVLLALLCRRERDRHLGSLETKFVLPCHYIHLGRSLALHYHTAYEFQ